MKKCNDRSLISAKLNNFCPAHISMAAALSSVSFRKSKYNASIGVIGSPASILIFALRPRCRHRLTVDGSTPEALAAVQR